MPTLTLDRSPGAVADVVAFVHEAPRLSSAVILAIRAGDPEALVLAAHRLATLSSRVGADELAGIAGSLERAATGGRLGVLRDGHGLGAAVVAAVRTCRARLPRQD